MDATAQARFAGGIVDRCTGDSDCTVRPGPHTYNGSYTKLTTRIRGPASAPTLSVVTESAHVDGANGHAVVVSGVALSSASSARSATVPHAHLLLHPLAFSKADWQC